MHVYFGNTTKENNVQKIDLWVRYICQAGIFAALYSVLTLLTAGFKIGGVEIRVAECMCVLGYFTPAIVPGMTLGCFIANLLLSGNVADLIFGTAATFLGVYIGRTLRHTSKWLVPLPTVLANTLIIPLVLKFAYKLGDGYFAVLIAVTLSEILCAYVLGMILLLAFKKPARKLLALQKHHHHHHHHHHSDN